MLSTYKANFLNPKRSWGNPFGTGVDGDYTATGAVNLTTSVNGNYMIKNYRNLTINSGATLSVSNKCAGLWLYVQDTLTLNGTIDMTGKGCYRTDDSDKWLHPWKQYLEGVIIQPQDLPLIYYVQNYLQKLPNAGGAGGAQTGDYLGGAGNAGVNGQTGGGACGGGARASSSEYGNVYAHGGAGSAGYCYAGGTGGSGGYAHAHTVHYSGSGGKLDGNSAQAKAQSGGASVQVGHGAGQGTSGGIILVIDKRIVSNSGLITAKGLNGAESSSYNAVVGLNEQNQGTADGYAVGHGGGSGGGSAIVIYGYKTGVINYNFNGGTGFANKQTDTYASTGQIYASANAGAGSFLEHQVPEKYILGRYE